MNRQKHVLKPQADTPSDGQALFIRRLRLHRVTVRTARILILILFLLLWEFCADQGIIDSFIFSSPSRIALCFYEMTVDRSIFLHIGITLYETIVSFLLVTAIGILAAVLLWCSRSPLRDPGALPGRPEQPAEVRTGAPSHRMAGRHVDHHHRGRYVCSHIRQHHEPVYQLHNG